MSEKVVELSDAKFDEKVLNANNPVMLDLWAPWCGPCRMVTPLVEELADEYDGKVDFYKINIDDNQDTAAQYGVTSIPTILFFNDGEEVNRLVGAQSKDKYKAVLDDMA